MNEISRQSDTFAYRLASDSIIPHDESFNYLGDDYWRARGGPTHPGPWYHASPNDIPIGTVLVPGGGESAHQYNSMSKNRGKWVFIAPSIEDTFRADTGPHIYEVEPEGTPYPYNNNDEEGYAVPSARIVKKIDPQEVSERSHKYLYGSTSQKLYRVMDLSFPDHPHAKYFGNSHKSFSRVPELMAHDPHGELGDLILNGLKKGTGQHWTTSQGWARKNSWHHTPGDKEFQVILGMDHPIGLGHKTTPATQKMFEQYPDEHEVMLKRGTPITVSHLWFRGPQQEKWSKIPISQPWQGVS